MDQTDKDRFQNMADAYDGMCRVFVPHYDFLQDEIIRAIRYAGIDAPAIVDLGAGSGILIDQMLRAFPTATCCWMDFSSDFERVARARLEPYGDRVRFVRCSFMEDWKAQLEATPNVIVSMSAIHHLEDGNKRRLYERCFATLAEGGLLINVDEMKSLGEAEYMASLRFWSRYVDEAAAALPPDQQDAARDWVARFDRWRVRNIENAHLPKREGDDMHCAFLDQLTMLREAGFESVDLYLKYHLWCMIGGRKPVRTEGKR
jgi:tRNA (cmo5U34)-methyltransferase